MGNVVAGGKKTTGFEHPNIGKRSERWPGISMRALGRKLGVSGSYVSRILSGDRQGSLQVIVPLAEKLGMSVEGLLKRVRTGAEEGS